jgi:AhpD family alkylhydroperoxidase
MATVKLVSDDDATPEAKQVFDDIRKTRNSEFVNNAWRAMANHPEMLARNWGKAKAIMGPGGALDPLTKEMIYLAVSIINNCEYCIHSHTYFARQKGMSEQHYNELIDIIGLAAENNAYMNAMQVPVDDVFKVDS